MIECPVCNVEYSKEEINEHVNSCLSAIESWEETENVNTTACHRSTAPPPKKLKLDDGRSLTPGTNEQTEFSHEECSSQSEQIKPPIFVSAPAAAKSVQNAFSLLRQSINKKPLSTGSSPGKNASPSPSDKAKRHKLQPPARRVAASTLASAEPKCATPLKLDLSLHEAANVNSTTSNSNRTSNLKYDHRPLAERLRPLTLDDFIGQDDVIGQGCILRRLLMSNQLPSLIFWGPPGCGKTTLARIVAARCETNPSMRFVYLSAAAAGVADLKEAVKIAKNELHSWKRQTILFIDEIHRFNKLQQDSFLPHVEDGTVVLLGATTENPSFHINNALLSRCKVIVLKKLTVSDIEKILYKGISELGITILDDEETNKVQSATSQLCIQRAAIRYLALHCDGDARSALNTLQANVDAKSIKNSSSGPGIAMMSTITVKDVKEVLQRASVQYDKMGEEHYNCVSALQKSIRGSDDNAAIYWLTRMLLGGEDPMYIARRLVVCASEDIGLADPHALVLAVACQQACHLLGSPECQINLSHCVTYLARAPKSNEAYLALKRAKNSIHNHQGPLPSVPLHLRNAPTKLMKDLGYGKGYMYNHDYDGPVDQEYLPEELKGITFFEK